MITDNTKDVATQIKNKELVKERRRQIVDGAVKLFIEHGYHKTTTRALAKATGLSIGSMYEYISTKDDILYLVCTAIHAEVEYAVKQALSRSLTGPAALAEVISEYFLVCNRMSDHILLMYQATHFLPPKWQKKVLEAELRITNIFIQAIKELEHRGALPKSTKTPSTSWATTFPFSDTRGHSGDGILPKISALPNISNSRRISS